jgi:divalent metal cation (Fe/Co/Zn/Cd) transporter
MDKWRRALRLEYFTVGYNLIEATASIIAGSAAGSIALVGFGLDSIVESLSGVILIWRLRRHQSVNEMDESEIEEKAVRFVGVTFWILGLYVLFESVRTICLKERPQPSNLGLAIALCSLVVMPWLGLKKFRIGQTLGLESLKADAKETFVCAALSLSLFIGLAANALFGFWLADPLTGLVIAGFLFKEGYEMLFEKEEPSETESC